MRHFVALMLLLVTPVTVLAGGVCDPTAHAMASGCGENLKKNGWEEVARCDDAQQWAYVVEKDGNQRMCKGSKVSGNADESPCLSQPVDMTAFKALAAAVKEKQTPARNCWELAR